MEASLTRCGDKEKFKFQKLLRTFKKTFRSGRHVSSKRKYNFLKKIFCETVQHILYKGFTVCFKVAPIDFLLCILINVLLTAFSGKICASASHLNEMYYGNAVLKQAAMSKVEKK